MKNTPQTINFELIQRSLGYSITNKIILQEIEYFDDEIGKRIQRKYNPKYYFKEENKEENYFKSIVLKLASQIMIHEELKRESLKLPSKTNFNSMRVFKKQTKIDEFEEENT